MVNKMSPISKLRYLTAVLLFTTCVSSAQKIQKYFVANLQEKGTLYFILPQKGILTGKFLQDFNYDITYFSGTDSAIVNFSYKSERTENIKILTFSNQHHRFLIHPKKLYVEAKNNYWVYRYTSKMAYTDLVLLFSQNDVPELECTTSSLTQRIACSRKTWQRFSNVNNKIFRLIELNS